MSNATLTYFDFPGSRGEECRLALHIAGVTFTDERLDFEQWAARKADTPWGSLPYITVGDRRLGQTNTILRLIGTRHSLLPDDDWEAARHSEVLDAAESVRERFSAIREHITDETRPAIRKAFRSSVLMPFCGKLEALIEGPFFGGEVISVADVKVFVVLSFYVAGKADFVEPPELGPKTAALLEAVRTHPRVVDWYA